MKISRLAFTFVFFSFFLLACGKDEKSQPTHYYSYGSASLVGALLPLGDAYVPKNLSPKTFIKDAKTYAPLDIQAQRLRLSFDVITGKAFGKSIITFIPRAQGRPYFELLCPITEFRLDGVVVSSTEVQDPEGQGQRFWALDQSLSIGATHTLEIDYQLASDKITFTNGGVRLLTNMTDLNSANFIEHWVPVTFEDDAFTLELELAVLGASSTHQIFSNGEVSTTSPDLWKIKFPNYFTKSSFYVHLTNSPSLSTQTFTYQGAEKTIPVTVYGSSSDLVNDAVAILPSLFKEFEDDFGPYPHDSFIAYMHSGGGGMEYAGATITSLGALDHELFHSWFARSVMPAEGRSGWIDEAFASWRDNGYFQAPSLLQRSATNLSNYSPYRKSTPSNCYRDGRHLVAELDRELAEFGGMKVLMRLFFERYRNRVVTTEEFWDFLNTMSGANLSAYFTRYAFGNAPQPHSSVAEVRFSSDQEITKHPPPLSRQEILGLR